jgi:hypothetical protein
MYAMKNVTSVGRFWRDREGSTFLEFTVVFPLLVLTAFCTVDFALIMYGWAQANKAVQNGVRVAVVGAPVAQGINDLTYVEVDLGKDCSDPATGADEGLCEDIETVCIPTAADGNCTNGRVFDNVAFEPIFEQMVAVTPSLDLQRENVQITYRTMGLGFVGRPGGFPMEVTVELRCMTHQMFFLGAVAGWAFNYDNCPDGTSGAPIPSFATTLTTEALGS